MSQEHRRRKAGHLWKYKGLIGVHVGEGDFLDLWIGVGRGNDTQSSVSISLFFHLLP